MKSLFVCVEKAIDRHVGEEYDDIVEVSEEPTTGDIDRWAGIISGRIRRLWAQDEGSDDRVVEIYLDGPSPYNLILKNLRIILGKQDNMVLRLPYLSDVERIPDEETREVLERLGGRIDQPKE